MLSLHCTVVDFLVSGDRWVFILARGRRAGAGETPGSLRG